MRKNQSSHLYIRPAMVAIFVVLSCFFVLPSNTHAVTNPSVTINGGARSATDERVNLSIVVPNRVDLMRIANSRRELGSARWRRAKETFNGWFLPKRSGNQFVYVQFQFRDGGVSGTYFDSINLRISDLDGEQLQINNDEKTTASRRVVLNIGIPENARRMRISNDVDIAEAPWRFPRNEWFWTLDSGSGQRTVYLQFQYADGRLSNIFQDDIRLIEPINASVGVQINRGLAKAFSRDVVLSVSYSHGIKEIRVSNTGNFGSTKWEPATHLVPWKLSAGAGSKTVHVQFRDFNDQVQTATDSIVLESRSTSSGTTSVGASTLPTHSIVKGPGPGVYYVGVDRKLHPFPSSKVFYSWYTNFINLRFISGAELAKHEIGSPVCVRSGTWLVKFGSLPEVYAVEQGCRLIPLRSEIEAFLIYGPDWQQRLITLPINGQSDYGFVTLSAADSFTGAIDADADGVDKETEDAIGTSDKRKDTDGDKLSDYEEFFWWFTDATVRDTDGDGVEDGDEILRLQSPTGGGQIRTIAENTYFYPNGSMFRHSNRRYYFRAVPEGPLYMGWRTSDKRFTSHNFQERFIIQSPVVIPFNTRVRSLAQGVTPIKYPTTRRDRKNVPL